MISDCSFDKSPLNLDLSTSLTLLGGQTQYIISPKTLIQITGAVI